MYNYATFKAASHVCDKVSSKIAMPIDVWLNQVIYNMIDRLCQIFKYIVYDKKL